VRGPEILRRRHRVIIPIAIWRLVLLKCIGIRPTFRDLCGFEFLLRGTAFGMAFLLRRADIRPGLDGRSLIVAFHEEVKSPVDFALVLVVANEGRILHDVHLLANALEELSLRVSENLRAIDDSACKLLQCDEGALQVAATSITVRCSTHLGAEGIHDGLEGANGHRILACRQLQHHVMGAVIEAGRQLFRRVGSPEHHQDRQQAWQHR